MRWKFVKKDPLENVSMVTDYDSSDESSEAVLASLRKLDHHAIKIGWSWEKVPSDEPDSRSG